jgi:hypothetical protein
MSNMEKDKDTFWDDLGKDNAAAHEKLIQRQKLNSLHLLLEEVRITKAQEAVRAAFEQMAARLQATGCRVEREWAKGSNETAGLYIMADSLPFRILLEAEIAPNGGVLVSIMEEEAGGKRGEFAYPPEGVSVAAMVVAFDSAFRTVVARHRTAVR